MSAQPSMPSIDAPVPAGRGSAPLRVLLVSEDVPQPALGGLGKHVVALGNGLVRMGHHVTLLGSVEQDYEACREEMGFEGHFVSGLPRTLGWSEVRLGFFNPWNRPYYARRFAEVITRLAPDYDVVHYHGHFPMLGLYVPGNINFIQTRHDQGSECITHLRFRQGDMCRSVDPRDCAGCMHARPGPVRTALSAAAVRRYRELTASAFQRHPVIFVSDFLLRNYRRAVPQADLSKAVVEHNFIDESMLERHPRRGSRPRAPGGLRIHIAGRLDRAKAIVEFMDLLGDRMPADWSVRIYGGGPLLGELKARHGHRPQVQILGHKGLEEVYASVSASDLAVVPSKWEEPFGSVTIEALRLGVTCLSLRRGGTPELVGYGAPGQLRLFDDLKAMADGLLAITPDTLPAQYPEGASADVQQRLPRLVQIYRAARV